VEADDDDDDVVEEMRSEEELRDAGGQTRRPV
jgi:hypothetical protein